jgi:O-antigen ligase
MATGIHANDRHTDITNHLLAMGVSGGLPLMAVFVLILVLSFRDVGRALRQGAGLPQDRRLFIWGLGALLFGFVMMFWTISLYDHSVVFFYLVLASIQALVGPVRAPARVKPAYAATPVASNPWSRSSS